MHPMIAKIWMIVTVILVLIPVILLLWRGVDLLRKMRAKREEQVLEAKEMNEVKEVLEDQQDEFITTNEYGSFSSSDVEELENEEEKTDSLEESALEEEPETIQLSEKEKKRLENLLREAQHLKNSGKIEEYEQKLIEGLSIDAESLLVLKPLSELYFALGNYKKAISLLKKVTEQDPSDHKAFWQIGEIYFITGYHQTAELLVEKAITLKNDNPKYYLTMVEIFYNTGRYPEALAYMEKIIKLRPTNPKYLLATAELYEEFGDLDNARKYYFNVLEYEASNEKARAKIKELSAN